MVRPQHLLYWQLFVCVLVGLFPTFCTIAFNIFVNNISLFFSFLGDFAVMLKAGMKVRQALAFQGVSSILAYIGMAIGVAVGNISALSLWIFALAAGMFLYIALADLVSFG